MMTKRDRDRTQGKETGHIWATLKGGWPYVLLSLFRFPGRFPSRFSARSPRVDALKRDAGRREPRRTSSEGSSNASTESELRFVDLVAARLRIGEIERKDAQRRAHAARRVDWQREFREIETERQAQRVVTIRASRASCCR